MTQPRNRVEPTWGQAPVVGQPDPHTENAGESLALVGTTVADTLKEIIVAALDEMTSDNATPEQKAQAKARVLAGLECNDAITQAQASFAQGRVAQTALFGQDAKGFTHSDRADKFAEAAAEHFSQSREHLTRASEGLGLQPALAKVLEKTGQTVGGFFQRIGRTTVSLQALASRAIALPGMVRNKIAAGVVSITDAIQGSLNDFHTATAQRIDSLRDKAAEIAGNAYGRVVDAGIAVVDGVGNKIEAAGNAVSSRVGAVRDSVGNTINTVRDGVNTRIDAVRDGVNSKVEAGKVGVAIAGAGVAAVGDTLDGRVITPLRTWLANTALPAIKSFATEFEQEFNERFEQRKAASVSVEDRIQARRTQLGGEQGVEAGVSKAHGMS